MADTFTVRVCQHSVEVAGLCEVGGTEVTVTELFLREYVAAIKEYGRVQDELSRLAGKEIHNG